MVGILVRPKFCPHFILSEYLRPLSPECGKLLMVSQRKYSLRTSVADELLLHGLC